MKCKDCNKSSQHNLGRATSLPITVENVLARCTLYLCNAHCRWVQSLSCWYATSTLQCHILPLYVTLRCSILHSAPPYKICPFQLGIPPHQKNIVLWPNWTITIHWTSIAIIMYYKLVQTDVWSLQSLDTSVPNPTLYCKPNHNLLTPLQPTASILHTSPAQKPKWPGTNMPRNRSDHTLPNLKYLDVDIDACTMRNPCCAIFSCRLAQMGSYKVSASKKSPSVKIVTADCTCSVLSSM